MAKCGSVGIWSHNSEEHSASAEHLKSISGQIGRRLDIYVCVLWPHSFSFEKNILGKGELSFTISYIVAVNPHIVSDYAH